MSIICGYLSADNAALIYNEKKWCRKMFFSIKCRILWKSKPLCTIKQLLVLLLLPNLFLINNDLTKTIWNMLKYMHQPIYFQLIWTMYIYFCIVSGPTNAPTTPGLPLTTDRINSIPRTYHWLFHFQNRVLNLNFIYQNCRGKSHYVRLPKEINTPRKKNNNSANFVFN